MGLYLSGVWSDLVTPDGILTVCDFALDSVFLMGLPKTVVFLKVFFMAFFLVDLFKIFLYKHNFPFEYSNTTFLLKSNQS